MNHVSHYHSYYIILFCNGMTILVKLVIGGLIPILVYFIIDILNNCICYAIFGPNFSYLEVINGTFWCASLSSMLFVVN